MTVIGHCDDWCILALDGWVAIFGIWYSEERLQWVDSFLFAVPYVIKPGAVLAQKILGALPPSAPSSPSPFSPFSETEKIRTSYRPTFETYH